MKTAQELRAGNVVKIGNDAMVVLKAEYNKSGRNAAVVKLAEAATGAGRGRWPAGACLRVG